MTKSGIKKYHKIIGYLNLILSVLYLIFSRESELIERLFAVLAINVGYHMVYYFFAGIYKGTKLTRSHNDFNKSIGGIMIGLFAIFGFLASIFLIYIFVHDAITMNEYYRLFAICIPFGILLGAYSLWIDIRNEEISF
ncbi:hypothetical protein FBALC1_08293 [Flavobacteriales bacterium ALC-1]|nr:hypothetical protein FBALC1_08293 [Flavobacteriales bacterium ALC-1]